MASPTACRRGSACSTFAETVPTSAHRECSSATGVTWARSNSMCSARDSAHWGGLAAASVMWQARVMWEGRPVQPGVHPGYPPFATLLPQPLEPFYPPPDVLERAGVGLLISDMVLDGPGEQLAHAIGSAWLVTAKQDVVARLIHGAPSEGMARPGGRYDRSRTRKAGTERPVNSSSPS